MKEEQILLKALGVLNDALDGKPVNPEALRCAESMTLMLWSGVYQERLKKEQIKDALAQMPKIEVLHIYLLIDGEIQVRLNIAGYEPGDARKCWDNTIRQPKIWVVCTAPVSRPPEPIKRRGFQGFRYTEELW